MSAPGLKTLRRCTVWLRGRFVRGAVVLGYHRIASAVDDPFGLVVSLQHFGEQIEAIRALANPLPLAELVDRALRGSLPPRALAITVGDAYSKRARCGGAAPASGRSAGNNIRHIGDARIQVLVGPTGGHFRGHRRRRSRARPRHEGVAIIYVPECAVCHLDWREEAERIQQYEGMPAARGGFYGKYLRRGDALHRSACGRPPAPLATAMGGGIDTRTARGGADRARYVIGLLPGIRAGWSSGVQR